MDNNFFKAQKEAELQGVEIPPFIRTQNTGDKVFYVVNGEAHWVKNPESLEALGGSFGVVQNLDYDIFLKLDVRVEPINMENVSKFPKFIKPTPIVEVKKELSEFPPELGEPQNPESAPQAEPLKGFTSIIIPAYFRDYFNFHYTGNCIGSVREHTDKVSTPYEIILVINGKTAVNLSKPEESYADKIIQNDENMGYAYAMNQGIRAAKGEYIVLLNNDVQVFNVWLQDFIYCLKEKDLVMSTPMYGKPFARALEAEKLRKENDGKTIAQTFSDFRDFSCVATKKALFNELGLFNEKFFVYKEDLDLFNRMDKAGKTYASTKLVNTSHIIGATSYGMSDAETKKEEGARVYKELWEK